MLKFIFTHIALFSSSIGLHISIINEKYDDHQSLGIDININKFIYWEKTSKSVARAEEDWSARKRKKIHLTLKILFGYEINIFLIDISNIT